MSDDSNSGGSNGCGAIAKALACAQRDFPPIPRDRTVRVATRTGGSYTFNYAPLDTILDAVRKPLADNELAIAQLLDGTTLVTLLLHSSGGELRSVLAVPQSEEIQKLGSAITYLRRYALQAMLGIAAEEDDDGNAQDGNAREIAQRSPEELFPKPGEPHGVLPACPECKTAAHVIKGKKEFGGGFVCYKAKGGCGKKWNPEADATLVQPRPPETVPIDPAPDDPEADRPFYVAKIAEYMKRDKITGPERDALKTVYLGHHNADPLSLLVDLSALKDLYEKWDDHVKAMRSERAKAGK